MESKTNLIRMNGREHEINCLNDFVMEKKILLRNLVRCKKCGDIIESRSTHDHQVCKCGFVSVDGGLEYTRVNGEEKDYEALYRWMTVDNEPMMSPIELIRALDHKTSRARREIIKN